MTWSPRAGRGHTVPGSRGRPHFTGLLAPPDPLPADDEADAPAAPSQELAPAPTAGPARLESPPQLVVPLKVRDARAAVLAAWTSVQTGEPWADWSGRLPAGVSARLAQRVAADARQMKLRPRLAQRHYVEAALGGLPFDDLEKVARLGREWRLAHLHDVPAPNTSPGTALRAGTAEQMGWLTADLKTLRPGRVTVQDVLAAAVTALLDELEDSPVTL